MRDLPYCTSHSEGTVVGSHPLIRHRPVTSRTPRSALRREKRNKQARRPTADMGEGAPHRGSPDRRSGGTEREVSGAGRSPGRLRWPKARGPSYHGIRCHNTLPLRCARRCPVYSFLQLFSYWFYVVHIVENPDQKLIGLSKGRDPDGQSGSERSDLTHGSYLSLPRRFRPIQAASRGRRAG